MAATKAGSKVAKLRVKRTDTESAADIAKAMSTALRKKTQELRRQRYERDGVEVLKPANEDTPTPIQSEARVMLQPTDVDNPLYSRDHDGEKTNPRKITAMMNLRESPVAMMAAKGHLDEHHVKAAIEFRRLFEALGGAGAGSFDYSREIVDGGGVREPITDRQVDAGIKLAQCERHLGKRPYAIVSKVAGEGVSIAMLGTSHRERTTLADYLRHALDDLAELWGMKTKGRRPTRLANL